MSENAGGMRAGEYGITKDYVMALRAVRAKWRYLSKLEKNHKRCSQDIILPGILIGELKGTLARS